ncbi:LD-carboxypeptidase [Streptomyces sp. NPDC050485]|uniref:LD-carboxypeptidase n=1 Tax=Streptomyces sp. NPDC050485 TaxID=3365617 RepID=UPI003789FF0E
MTAVPLTRPARLGPGARIAVVATSGPVVADRLRAGLGILRGWGLEPAVTPQVAEKHPEFGYLAGEDEKRARDFQEAWCDPAVDAVMCARGGYGAQRMVDLLDWTALRAAGPKVLIGYSDVTALHEAFAVRLGLATLYGPMASAATFLQDAATREFLRTTLFEPEAAMTLGLPGARPLVPGRTRGITLGGYLTVLAADRATPHARPSAAGGLLLLEDVGQEDYQLDRGLTQLLRAGWLEGVSGIALGSWQDCGPYEERVRPVLYERLSRLGVPVVENLGFGHCGTALTMPLGVPAVLDADGGTLTLEMPALA